jgi:PhnB protein
MPIQQTFWSPRFGMLVDKFGIPWMVNCEQAAPETAGSAA